jgi:hypothetical protein
MWLVASYVANSSDERYSRQRWENKSEGKTEICISFKLVGSSWSASSIHQMDTLNKFNINSALKMFFVAEIKQNICNPA